MAIIVLPIYSLSATVVLGPAERPPTGHLTCQIMRHYRLRALFCPPTIFEQLVQEPGGLESSKQLDFLLYAGGPLTANTGDLLSQMTDVCQFYGSTETGAIPALIPRREDWASLEWHPSYSIEMKPAEDDAFELVLRKNPTMQTICSLFSNFPEVEEWHTKDLFRPQPNKPNLWQFHGRKDDIIVLSNGEKFNPVPSEAIIAGHPLLSAALIVGLGRFQPALLLEPKESTEMQKDSLVDTVWSYIEAANAQAPGHARITRTMIAVASASKAFERAGKGTVIRKLTADKFSHEIDALYSNGNFGADGPQLGTTDDFGAVEDYVRACIACSFAGSSLGADDDFYVAGLDSLKTIEIMGMLKAGLGDHESSWISVQMMYTNPTIRSLSKMIQHRLNSRDLSEESDDPEQSRVARMASLVHKYTKGLSPAPLQIDKSLLDSKQLDSKLTVVLTGSMGSLGTHLLRCLLDDPKVGKIYCLNRTSNAREKQEESFKHLGLPLLPKSSRIQSFKADYSRSNLGLAEAVLGELSSEVNVIVHNAWKVDFNHSLMSFEPVHIQGVRHIIDLSLASRRRPHIVFVSSTSSVRRHEDGYPNTKVKEEPILNHTMAQRMGYAESKNVSECILEHAKINSGVPVSVLRIGQIAGPVMTNGVWNRDEWFPSLVETSRSLGCIPSHIPDADWVPVDIIAKIILDIAHFAVDTGHTWTYNIVNPKPTAWKSLIGSVLGRLGPQVEVVELSSWVRRLEQVSQQRSQDIDSQPAAKILDFYRDMERGKVGIGLSFDTAHGSKASQTMASMEPVSVKWMETWLDQWGY